MSSLGLAGLGLSSVGQTLLPGEIVKNSGKFAKPTKIPGKNYSKDEIIIRNADSGKGELPSIRSNVIYDKYEKTFESFLSHSDWVQSWESKDEECT
jgi:hypothetical protein